MTFLKQNHKNNISSSIETNKAGSAFIAEIKAKFRKKASEAVTLA